MDFSFDKIQSRIFNNITSYLTDESLPTRHSVINILSNSIAKELEEIVFYFETLFREAFWQTAQYRESVIANSQLFGYKIRSKIGAVVDIKLGSIPSDLDLTIPIFSSFTTNEGITFSTIKEYTASSSSPTISVTQGIKEEVSHQVSDTYNATDIYYTFTFSIDDPEHTSFYLAKGTEEFARVDSIFLHASLADKNVFEVSFNNITDGSPLAVVGITVFASEVSASNIFTLKYLKTEGKLERRIRPDEITIVQDTYKNSDNTDLDITVSNDGYSTIGADYESIAEIKQNAERYLLTNNRLVTIQDYENTFTNASSGSRLVDKIRVVGESEIRRLENRGFGLNLPPDEENVIYIYGLSQKRENDNNTLSYSQINISDAISFIDSINATKGASDTLIIENLTPIRIIFHIGITYLQGVDEAAAKREVISALQGKIRIIKC